MNAINTFISLSSRLNNCDQRIFSMIVSLLFNKSSNTFKKIIHRPFLCWRWKNQIFLFLIFLPSSPNNRLRLHFRPRRLVDQLKKVFASRSDVANADRSSSLGEMGEMSVGIWSFATNYLEGGCGCGWGEGDPPPPRHTRTSIHTHTHAGFSQCLTRHTPERFGVFPILSQWNEYN